MKIGSKVLAAAALPLLAMVIVACSPLTTLDKVAGVAGARSVSSSSTSSTTGGAWSASGPGTVTVVSDGSTSNPEMTYSLSGPSVYSTQTWQFSTTATGSGSVTLPFHYTGYHAFFQVRVFVQAFVTNSSGTTVTTLISEGPTNCCTAPSGGFNLTGSGSFTVQAGDTYGFRFGGSNFDSDARLDGDFTVETTIPVNIDIKPGSSTNPINTKSKGVIPVAILGSSSFDVTTVNAMSLRFGPNQAPPTDKNGGSIEDVNGDGINDLVSHFKQQATGIAVGDTDATLTGDTTNGMRIVGSDSVRVLK